jgi:hypothetical protein
MRECSHVVLAAGMSAGLRALLDIATDASKACRDAARAAYPSLVQRNSGLWYPPGQGSQIRREREVETRESTQVRVQSEPALRARFLRVQSGFYESSPSPTGQQAWESESESESGWPADSGVRVQAGVRPASRPQTWESESDQSESGPAAADSPRPSRGCFGFDIYVTTAADCNCASVAIGRGSSDAGPVLDNLEISYRIRATGQVSTA